jgi:hypothetical protein
MAQQSAATPRRDSTPEGDPARERQSRSPAMIDDPRQWKITINDRRLVSLEELVNRLYEAGFRLVGAGAAPAAASDEPLSLTPELLDRLRRVAKATKQSMRAVLCDAVQRHWVGFAARTGLKPEEW